MAEYKRKWRQSRLYMPRVEWAEYHALLVRERAAGHVFGWTNFLTPDGRMCVVVSHI